MLKKILKKKGISPLVATVLLIAFAVALGALVISFGQSFLQNQIGTSEKVAEGSLDCTNIRLTFEEVKFDIDGGDSVSGHSGEAVLNISFYIESELVLRVKDFTLVAQTEDGDFQKFSEVNTTWNPGVVPIDVTGVDFRKITYYIDLDPDNDESKNITKVILIPVLSTREGTETRSCNNQKETLNSDSTKYFIV